ncbi:autophagy-related protein 8C-like isoform X1 [Malus domestica]|uniref:autophagy-related protein 8C-like isoform X1 n=1 Tax=Malus domestica TaxID=3750 RepID=UPI0039749490
MQVSVETDARRDVPGFRDNKYHVHRAIRLGAFVKLIQLRLEVIGITDPVFVYSKNTAKPPNEILMSAIDKDEENKDEDGFLHLIYTNEEEGVPIPAKKAATRHKSPCRFKRRKKIGMIQFSTPIGLLDSWNLINTGIAVFSSMRLIYAQWLFGGGQTT